VAVMPNIAHTYVWEKRGLEFDNFVGFDIYSENGSSLTQITNDTGPIADVLHGFEGRASGPMALWVAKVEKLRVIVQLCWVNEFKVTNLLKGNTFLFGLTLRIN
jgi:hypothetical protein